MEIRRAVAEDASGIAEVARSVRYRAGEADPRQGYLVFVGTPGEYAARLVDNNTSYVADEDGRILGFLLMSESAGDTATHTEADGVEVMVFGEGALLVDQIGVCPNARERGVAAQLFARMLAEQKPTRLTASIMHGPLCNRRSTGFFAGKQGFRCIGEYHEGHGFLWGLYEWKLDGTQGDIRYPIGRWFYSGVANKVDLAARIERLNGLPGQLRSVIETMTEAQLDVVPRPGAWTARQLVHHLADAHGQMTGRARLILTEEQPLVKTFDENTWAELADARSAPVEESLRILDGLHARISRLIGSRSHSDMLLEMCHPEQGLVRLDRLLAYMDWHGRHHTAQIGQIAL